MFNFTARKDNKSFESSGRNPIYYVGYRNGFVMPSYLTTNSTPRKDNKSFESVGRSAIWFNY